MPLCGMGTISFAIILIENANIVKKNASTTMKNGYCSPSGSSSSLQG